MKLKNKRIQEVATKQNDKIQIFCLTRNMPKLQNVVLRVALDITLGLLGMVFAKYEYFFYQTALGDNW